MPNRALVMLVGENNGKQLQYTIDSSIQPPRLSDPIIYIFYMILAPDGSGVVPLQGHGSGDGLETLQVPLTNEGLSNVHEVLRSAVRAHEGDPSLEVFFC